MANNSPRVVGDESGLASLIGDGGAWPVGQLLAAVRAHLGMEVAFVSEFVDGRRVFRHVDAATPGAPIIAVGGSDPLEDSYCLRVVDGRLPELIRDAMQEPGAAELEATAALPVGAHLSVPIRLTDGTVYGTFCCFSKTPDLTLTERDLAMMRVLAEIVAGQLDRAAAAQREHDAIAARVRPLVAGHGLSMVFQPIVDLDERHAVGFEALARFSAEPVRGPAEWFAEAALAGMAVDLELAAIRQAVRRLPDLPPDVYLAVNASATTITHPGLGEALRDVPRRRIVVEITENEAITAYDVLDQALLPLRRSGVRVAVDDAGAGYASFRHILRLRPDIIKLDMDLTSNVDRDPARRAVASAFVRFASDTGSSVVAEGIESDAQVATLRRLGVRNGQGYLLGRPAPVAAPAHAT